MSIEGLTALDNPTGYVTTATSVAVLGWAAFSFDAAMFGAPAVAVHLSSFRGALSRGSRDEARPLVGAFDWERGIGYWSNVTEQGSGWVAKLRLDGVGEAAYSRAPSEQLAAREQRRYGVAPIETYQSRLYARYTATSELGYELAPRPPAAQLDEHDSEYQTLIEYVFEE